MATDYWDTVSNNANISVPYPDIYSSGITWTSTTNVVYAQPYGWGYFRITADRFLKEDVQETLKKIFEIINPGLTMVLNTVEGDKIYIVTSQLIPDVSNNPQMFDPISIPEYKWLAHYESVLLYKAVNGH